MRILVTGGSGFIGTNLIDELLERKIEFINLDVNPPRKPIHRPYWKECDILDFDMTMSNFDNFQPTHVVHLAARTDTLSSNIDDYKVNTEGTNNLLLCVQATQNVERVMITSSQFAFAPPGIPPDDEEFNPIGAYGMSKALSERATRSADLDCVWTIIRPTNIWGPWHPRYPHEFWLVLKEGYYLHPGGKPTIRSYGYVKNIVYQMLMILEAVPSVVNGKVYYVGDPPIPLFDWANGFSLAIAGKPVKIIPRPLLKTISAVGSLLNYLGLRFPISLSRYRSMTEDYYSPVDITIRQFGVPPYSLRDGITETVNWLNLYWNDTLS